MSNLYMFLCGYWYAGQLQEAPDFSQDKEFEKFQPWIEKRFNITASVSWDKIILLFSSNEQHAFERFFQLLDEFKETQHLKKVTDAEDLARKAS
ncbi:MAG: hypothetical protein AAFR99_17580 [Cyanobacteria bacterium J06629_9]